MNVRSGSLPAPWDDFLGDNGVLMTLNTADLLSSFDDQLRKDRIVVDSLGNVDILVDDPVITEAVAQDWIKTVFGNDAVLVQSANIQSI